MKTCTIISLSLFLLYLAFASCEKGAIPCFYWDEKCTVHHGIDFPGNDLAVISVKTLEECCSNCKSLDGCMQWVAKTLNENQYDCHLKSKFGFPTYCNECSFSFTQTKTCVDFCQAVCHNLGETGPSLCGTDGYSYESPCQAECHGVELARPGPC